eukprot:SAG25_NODE_445_length_7958_cov_9.538109_3_plen_68_part_00
MTYQGVPLKTAFQGGVAGLFGGLFLWFNPLGGHCLTTCPSLRLILLASTPVSTAVTSRYNCACSYLS